MWRKDGVNFWSTEAIVTPGDTIPSMFWQAAQQRRSQIICRQKILGLWQQLTWQDLAQHVQDLGLGLIELGFAVADTASILGNTRQEWLMSDLAVLCAGGVSSGIYPTDAASQVAYLMADSRSRYIFVEDDEQLDKVLEVRDQLPELQYIFVWDMEGLQTLDDPRILSFEALQARGQVRRQRLGAPACEQEWQSRINARAPEDLAILIYTSGTTGRPKGAMLSHRNVITAIRGFNTVVSQNEHDERMNFLPLCHVAERLGGVYFGLYTGTKLNFVEHPDTVPENVREIAPTVMIGVPRVWEKFYSAVNLALRESLKIEQVAYALALKVGMQIVQRYEAGQTVGLGLRALHRVARWLVLDNVRKLIGIHRCRFLVTGAAPISPDLIRWYLALGVPMLEVWGQTETCGGSTAMPIEAIRPGTIGQAAHYNEMRIDSNGEILVRGPNVFMGYLNLPEKTAETLQADGWLRTGDVGSVDAEGYFRIHDRLKDIIITAGGKNITPSEIENQLKFSPYITDAVIIGDRRPYLVCLIMIDQDNVEKYAQELDVPFSNYTSLCRAPEIQRLIAGEVERVNREFARVEQIKAFRLIENKLTAEDEELTPTMKLKRKLVQEKYAEMIESMYR